MQIVNLGELIDNMSRGDVMSQADLIDVLGSFLKDADVGEVHVHNCSKCGSNVHGNKVKKDNIKRNNIGKAKSSGNCNSGNCSSTNHHIKCEQGSFSNDMETTILSGHNGVPITGSNLSDEDIALLNFADMYISAYKAGNNMEEYKKFFIDNVLPVPTLQGIAKYIK